MTLPGPIPTDAREKRSWPLVALAVSSFIPGLGFFLGAIALSWAMVTSRKRAKLAGVIAACGLIGNAGVMAFGYFLTKDSPEIVASRVTVTKFELVRVVAALDDYHRAHESYPASLQILVGIPNPLKPLNVYDQSAGLTFPLKLYQYSISADGEHFDLFAVGADKEPGTSDDIRPALSDSVAAVSGYRAPK